MLIGACNLMVLPDSPGAGTVQQELGIPQGGAFDYDEANGCEDLDTVVGGRFLRWAVGSGRWAVGGGWVGDGW